MGEKAAMVFPFLASSGVFPFVLFLYIFHLLILRNSKTESVL